MSKVTVKKLLVKKAALERRHQKLHDEIEDGKHTLSDAEITDRKQKKCKVKTEILAIETQIAALQAETKKPRLVHARTPESDDSVVASPDDHQTMIKDRIAV